MLCLSALTFQKLFQELLNKYITSSLSTLKIWKKIYNVSCRSVRLGKENELDILCHDWFDLFIFLWYVLRLHRQFWLMFFEWSHICTVETRTQSDLYDWKGAIVNPNLNNSTWFLLIECSGFEINDILSSFFLKDLLIHPVLLSKISSDKETVL